MAEIGEQPIFERGQLDRIAVDGDARGARVDPHGPDFDVGRGMAGGAAHQRAQARQQFFGVERLGDVIVGAGVEARDLVAPAVARGEDKDRKHLARLAPAFQHGDAVELGKPEVEHNRVVRFGVAEEVTFLAVGRGIDDIAGIAQRLFQLALQILVVFHKQNAHINPVSIVPASGTVDPYDLARLRIDVEPQYAAFGREPFHTQVRFAVGSRPRAAYVRQAAGMMAADEPSNVTERQARDGSADGRRDHGARSDEHIAVTAVPATATTSWP